MAEPTAKRTFGTSSEEDRSRLVAAAVPKNTQSSTTYWVSMFASYWKEKKSTDFDGKVVSHSDLASVLEGFYADARKKDGSEFKRNSLMAARGALNRHLLSLRADVNLFQGDVFRKSNAVLNGILKDKKRSGREAAVAHKTSLSDADLMKIEEYFSDILECQDPRKLTFYVWYQVTIHFCLRGGEVQRQLRKTDLVLDKLPDGREFFKLNKDFMSKNHQGGLTGSEFTSDGIITDEKQVNALKLYISKLHPEQEFFFQRAKCPPSCKLSHDLPSWYCNSPLSHNMLGGMMARISSAADLSKTYTNHCVRATSIQSMKKAGIEDRKICAISGHANVQSIAAYDKTTVSEACSIAKAIDGARAQPATEPLDEKDKENVKLVDSTVSEHVQPVVSTVPDKAASVNNGFVMNAGGAKLKNVTFNLVCPPRPRNPRLPLTLKKRRSV